MALTRPVTMWVVADLSEAGGRQLYYNAIKALKHSHKIRLGLIHNPASETVSKKMELDIPGLVQTALLHLPDSLAKSLVTKLVKEDNAKALASGEKSLDDLEVHVRPAGPVRTCEDAVVVVLQGMKMSELRKRYGYVVADDPFRAVHASVARGQLGLAPGASGVVVNGQLIGPLSPGETLESEDFGLVERVALAKGAGEVAEQVESWGVETADGRSSDTVARVMALVLASPSNKRRHWVVLANDEHSAVSVPAEDETTAAFDVVAIVDPLSRDAQKLGPLLSVLGSVVNADLKVVLNPKPKLSEMPLKSFYRLVLEPELQFTGEGALRAGPLGRFSSLPTKTLLTLNLIAPEAWMVEAVTAVYDLDNIKMEGVDGDVVAGYELEHILLEGHCFDEVTGQPPRGLQFILGAGQQPDLGDTIVMANLGYFQLKANPGAWALRLRDGRSADIYSITSHSQTESAPGVTPVAVVMDSFAGKTIRVKVAKRPGKESEKLLGEPAADEQGGGIWQSISE